jgi:DnaJ-class molecular chaperone
MRDPYRLLGVPRTASQEEIKKAYRRLVKQLHPDINPGNKAVEQRFKEVSAAYDVVGDPARRARFDRGEIDAEGRERADAAWARDFARRASERGERGARGARGRSRGSSGFAAGDIFEEMFGGGRVKTRGTDVSYGISVDFLEAARGCRRRVDLSDGSSVEITVPAGVEDRRVLRLRGKGLAGLGGGESGDALVEVRVEPHPFFTRQGRDIHVEVPVTLHEAVLGASIEVPTIEGKVAVKVPPGSNTGTQLRLRGRGIPSPEGAGSQVVRLKIVLPEGRDEELEAFLARWRPAGPYDPRRKAGIG